MSRAPYGPNDVTGGVGTGYGGVDCSTPTSHPNSQTYNGGNFYDPALPHPATTCDYLGGGGGTVGGLSNGSYLATGAASAYGRQTWVFKWFPNDPNNPGADPPPGQVLVRKHVFAYVETYGADSYVQVKDVSVSTGFGSGNETPVLYNDGYQAAVGVDGTAYEVVPAGDYVTVTLPQDTAPYASITLARPRPPAGTYNAEASCLYDARCETQITLQTYTPWEVYAVVTDANKVKGLSFNTDRHLQQATFNVKAGRADGQSLPSGATFTWSTPKGSNLDFAGHTAITTATATDPSLCYPTCTVVATINGVTYAGTGSAECAAIGGPITTKIVGVDQKPIPGSQGKDVTYNHDDNDPAKSFYITYFGYSHADASGQLAPVPKDAQPTQNATIETLSQPTISNPTTQHPGTTVTFGAIPHTFAVLAGASEETPGGGSGTEIGIDLGGEGREIASNLWALVIGDEAMDDPVAAVPLFMETIYAEDAFQDAVPTVHFHFDDGVISSDADDDSATTQVQSKDKQTGAVTWVPLVYKISSHMPGTLIDAGDPAEHPYTTQPPQVATYWTDACLYRYILLDTLGKPMPGIWTQERFTTPIPPGAKVNQSDNYWPTLLFSKLDITIPVNAQDGIWSGAGGTPSGYPKQYDALYYTWAQGDSTPYAPVHDYFAGTRNPNVGAPGVYLATYKIDLTLGTPGTARQTLQPRTP